MNKEISEYLLTLIEFLDGNGLTVTDWDTIIYHIRLSETVGYPILKEIMGVE